MTDMKLKAYIAYAKEVVQTVNAEFTGAMQQTRDLVLERALRPINYWEEKNANADIPPAETSAPEWFKEYSCLSPIGGGSFLKLSTKLERADFDKVLKAARAHGYRYDGDNRGFARVR